MKVLPTLSLVILGYVLMFVDATQKYKDLPAYTTTEKSEYPFNKADDLEDVVEELAQVDKAGKVRQCSCDEIETCSNEQLERHKPCAEKCLDELLFGKGNVTASKMCFHKNHEAIHACRKNATLRFCGIDKNTFFPKSEVYTGHHQRNQNSNATITESDNKRHFNYGFHAFLKATFGQDGGKAYIKCQRKCSQGRRKNKCLKKLNCGLKKFDQKDIKAAHTICKDQEEATKKQLCDCLTAAGIKNVVCTFNSIEKAKN